MFRHCSEDSRLDSCSTRGKVKPANRLGLTGSSCITMKENKKQGIKFQDEAVKHLFRDSAGKDLTDLAGKKLVR